MSEEGFHLFLGVMCVIALFVFIALYFVKAGYGMFRTASWGYSISNKAAWVLMEAPVFIVMFWLWGRSGAGFAVPVYLFFLLFQLHYFQRSFIFPFLLKGKQTASLHHSVQYIKYNAHHHNSYRHPAFSFQQKRKNKRPLEVV
jgi:3-oxo-5-alpha-steroid 4-dehydrogenase 1